MSLSSMVSSMSGWGTSIGSFSPKTKAALAVGAGLTALAVSYIAYKKMSEPEPLTTKDIRALPAYTTAIEEACKQEGINPTLQEMVAGKVDDLAKGIFTGSTTVSGSRAEEIAAKLAPGVSKTSPEYQVALQAAKDFEVLLGDAEKTEAHMFSITPAPAPDLSAISGAPVAPYSLLMHSARPASHLVDIAKTFGVQGIRDLVPLTPKRLVLHEMCKNVVLGHQIPSSKGGFDKQVATLVPALSEVFLKANPKLEETATAIRTTVEAQALELLNGGKVDKPIHSDLASTVASLETQVKKDSGLSAPEIKQAIARRAADLISESYVRSEVDKFDLSSQPLLTEHPALPTQTEDTRRMFMINGGVASGKGTAESEMIEGASKQGVNWDHVLTLNTDSFKGMLLDPSKLSPEHGEFYSGLTHDEASLIRNDILSTYREKLEGGTAPHLFVDQVWPAVDIIEMGAASKNGIDLTVVQIPVENSFQMAYHRGVSTGRFEHRPVILGSHSRVPIQLHESLDNAIKKKGVSNIRLQVLSNVSKGVVKPVAMIDFAKGEGVVVDMKTLLKFYQKTGLNKSAMTFGELYKTPEDKDHTSFEPLTHDLASFCEKGILVSQSGAPLYHLTGKGRTSAVKSGHLVSKVEEPKHSEVSVI